MMIQTSMGRDNLTEYKGNTNPIERSKTYFVSVDGGTIPGMVWLQVGMEWDGPKATIQAAIDIADYIEGDTVVVFAWYIYGRREIVI